MENKKNNDGKKKFDSTATSEKISDQNFDQKTRNNIAKWKMKISSQLNEEEKNLAAKNAFFLSGQNSPENTSPEILQNLILLAEDLAKREIGFSKLAGEKIPDIAKLLGVEADKNFGFLVAADTALQLQFALPDFRQFLSLSPEKRKQFLLQFQNPNPKLTVVFSKFGTRRHKSKAARKFSEKIEIENTEEISFKFPKKISQKKLLPDKVEAMAKPAHQEILEKEKERIEPKLKIIPPVSGVKKKVTGSLPTTKKMSTTTKVAIGTAGMVGGTLIMGMFS